MNNDLIQENQVTKSFFTTLSLTKNGIALRNNLIKLYPQYIDLLIITESEEEDDTYNEIKICYEEIKISKKAKVTKTSKINKSNKNNDLLIQSIKKYSDNSKKNYEENNNEDKEDKEDEEDKEDKEDNEDEDNNSYEILEDKLSSIINNSKSRLSRKYRLNEDI
jgi:uncharacterized protein YabN with tetrapyrrole methylase and pyrophosphatase domain